MEIAVSVGLGLWVAVAGIVYTIFSKGEDE